MKWFHKTFLWASLGCLGATTSASGQTNWRQAAVPLANDPAEIRVVNNGVSLGKPTPIAPETIRVVNAFVPIETPAIRQAAYWELPPPSVVRGARPIQSDEPKSLILPRELPPLIVPQVPEPSQPVQGAEPHAKIIEIDALPPKVSPAADPTERIVILESGCPGHGEGRSLFGPGLSGNQQFYASAEWLMWTARGFHLPPLVTTASPFDPPDTRGALGFGTTRLIFGDSDTAGRLRSGARFTLGYNCDPCSLWAIEGNFFFLSRKNDGATFDSNAFPVIGRPFFNVNTGVQDRELTTSPGLLAGDFLKAQGNLQVNTSSSLFGAELNSRCLLWTGCDFQVTGIAGFRYLNLSDGLSITENSTLLQDVPGAPGNPPVGRAGDQIMVFDRFDTHNRFYGAQIGVNGEWRRGPWSLDAHGKLGLGVTQQSVDIDGGQRISPVNGQVQNFTGGLYALSTNIGHHSQTRFGFVPELGLKVGYNFKDNIRVFVGYDFLYWSSVLRPGDQIDQSLNANIIPNFGAAFPATNQARPMVPFRTTSYWALGLNAGVEFRY